VGIPIKARDADDEVAVAGVGTNWSIGRARLRPEAVGGAAALRLTGSRIGWGALIICRKGKRANGD